MDAAAKALNRFETYNPIPRVSRLSTIEQAVGFKRHLAEQSNLRTGKPLSKATIHSTLAALKAFFVWLAGQPGFRSRLSYSDTDYFNDLERDSRIARTRLDKALPVAGAGPACHPNHAGRRRLPAQGPRAGGLDPADRRARRSGRLAQAQAPRLGGGPVSSRMPARWRPSSARPSLLGSFRWETSRGALSRSGSAYLEATLHWGPDDPLFPAPRMEAGPDRLFRPAGLDRRHWTTAGPIREIFRRAFGLPACRTTRRIGCATRWRRWASDCARTPEEFEAWAQNLGHSGMLTTFASYGKVEPARQAEIVRGLARPQAPPNSALDEIAAIVARIRHN